MVDPAHGALDESYTPEDDSQEVHSVFSEEGLTRRTDNGVNVITCTPHKRCLKLNFSFVFVEIIVV